MRRNLRFDIRKRPFNSLARPPAHPPLPPATPCSFSNLKRRAEDLFGEASTLQRRLNVPLPDEAAIPAEELETLERLHEKRLADMCGTICKKILAGIMAHKWSFPFNRPVDMKMYPDYSKKVDRAMDFGTIKANVEKNVYTHPEAFVEDVRLVFRNARSYNDPGSDVHAMARTLQEKFEDRYAASIVPRLVEAQKQRDADKIELRRRMAEQKALGGRERADGECAAIIQAIDSLLADVDIEKIKAKKGIQCVTGEYAMTLRSSEKYFGNTSKLDAFSAGPELHAHTAKQSQFHGVPYKARGRVGIRYCCHWL